MGESSAAVYDEIGAGYSRHRRPDPRIESAIHAALGDAETVLNVGAGTGSYEPTDRTVVAVDPSAEMIRQRPATAAPCARGDISTLDFDGQFDAAMALLTVHHWPQPRRGLRALSRVADRLVIFTFDPEIHNSFWLFRDYVPAIAELDSTAGVIGVDAIAEVIGADRVETIPVPHDCVDGFGWAYWQRPHAYLDPAVRACISGFGLVDQDHVAAGIERLRVDLDTGAWRDRHRDLLDLDAIDGGFRLIVRERR